MQNFGQRCWGASFALVIISIWNVSLPFWVRCLSLIVFYYFLLFGADRFTAGYKGII